MLTKFFNYNSYNSYFISFNFVLWWLPTTYGIFGYSVTAKMYTHLVIPLFLCAHNGVICSIIPLLFLRCCHFSHYRVAGWQGSSRSSVRTTVIQLDIITGPHCILTIISYDKCARRRVWGHSEQILSTSRYCRHSTFHACYSLSLHFISSRTLLQLGGECGSVTVFPPTSLRNFGRLYKCTQEASQGIIQNHMYPAS